MTRHPSRPLIVLGLTTIVLTGFSSCGTQTVAEICNEQIPGLQVQVTNAIAALDPWMPKEQPQLLVSGSQGVKMGSKASRKSRKAAERQLASVERDPLGASDAETVANEVMSTSYASEVAPVRVPEIDRAAWQSFAQSRLSDIERYIDLARDANDTVLTHELHQLANQLVALHGYSELGYAKKMTAAFQQILVQTDKIKTLACKKP